MKKELKATLLNASVIVVSLGYFVDIFDLTLFGMLRVQSLKDLGLEGDALITTGQFLINVQMVGMLLGGIFWGVLGDKKGRLSTLFASIILYSVANILNAFIHDIPSYAVLRFLSGVGLAGELGIGVTLVAEILPKESRGLGTALIATIGVFGAVIGGIVVEIFDWRTCYLIGGVLGLCLLFLRFQMRESFLFTQSHAREDSMRGSFFKLFTNRDRFSRFSKCIGVGIPIWFVAGIVMTFSPEIAKVLGVEGEVTSSRAIAISYLGLSLGDFLSGFISQLLKSRKKVIFLFQLITIIFLTFLFATTKGQNSSYYYFLCFFVGIGAGFWAIFVTIGAEQFGTNMRATVATSIPNFVRASVILLNLALTFFRQSMDLVTATITVGCIAFTISIVSTLLLHESFGKDLNYEET